MVKCLVENMDDLKEKDNDDNTPFHNACDGGNLDVVKYLVEEKRVYGSKNIDNYTLSLCV